MIAATHRSVLEPSPDPGQNRYHHAASKYLSKTLRGFQDALSNSISSTPADALMAVSLLLYHYAWSSVDHAAVLFALPNSPTVSRELTSSLNLAADPLLNLSVGLRYLFLKMGALAPNSESPWRQYARERPRVRIVQAVRRQQQGHDVLGQMESYLLGGYRSDTATLQLSADSLVNDTAALAAYSESAGRLAPILAVQSSSVAVRDDQVISSDSDPSSDPAVRLSDIIRYLFSYPIHFCDTFRSLVAAHDRRALFLLLHFFRAVGRLLPPGRCWWAQRRAILLEHQLECFLNDQSAVLEQDSLMRPTSSRLDAGAEYALYPVRDWLDGECIHGQF
ncbi:uncharacterized protein N7496_004998 [Penicillium cataractarum]|uniref:C6 transcription factor n=1 Tax=Penicillium cataractarum TaxID=2100454 RepID=A0A9W9VE96_9EURO|nr:uncharacterized protein N7496_004998 [Penicillium cataractarum]KAJ5377589.1 hypothetical protein N7496_004998 [Penicillium cataractarum]